MSRHLGSSPHTGDAVRPRNWTVAPVAILVVLTVVASGALLLAVTGPTAVASPVVRESPAATPAAPVTHGDLVVTSGETYVIQPSGGSPLYYQGGNITVEAGGTLIVRNVSLIFVEFVANTGTLAQRLSHIYTFTDAGTTAIFNSTVTTDMAVLNAFAKLAVTVTGTMSAYNSSFEFPGWLNVEGAGASLALNASAVTGNPQVPLAIEPQVILADTEFAPSLNVSGGASLTSTNTSFKETYADNFEANGLPSTLPLSVSGVDLGATGMNISDLSTPTDSINVTQDWLYGEVGISGGYVFATYNDSGAGTTSVNITIWFQGVGYPVGSFHFVNGTQGQLTIPIPAALTAEINTVGLLTWLNGTGDFGLPSTISLNISAVTGPAFTVTDVGIQLTPPLDFNLVATGSGTTVVAADSSVDLTWNQVPSSPLSTGVPAPWNSNKFLFEDGATGYLANVTVPNTISGVFSTSAVLTGASSTVYTYRWANFNISSAAGHFYVSGAFVVPFYAYNDNQAANATVTALNDVQTALPSIAGYLQYVDGRHGITKYGTSSPYGQSFVLLAATEINATTLPSGGFLGSYHIAVRTPYVTNATWISFAVSPYPTGVALGTLGFAQADRVNVFVPLAPPVVKFVYFSPATSPLGLNDQYYSNGTLFLNGPGTASITLYATPVGGGSQTEIGSDAVTGNGSFTFYWYSPLPLTAGTSYTLSAVASYKGATASYTLPGTYSVPSTTSATGFLFEKFLGLPLWLWIAIAAAAVVAILVVLMVFRRQAAGKLVECGECGELIPEDATVCPKCGAQFEADLVRCSRCSATIPANSQFCPECAAQLLGAPGSGGNEPERQAYADFTEKFRTEAKRELGDNYTESAFWDWWRRQPSYVSFSQWSVQQNKGVPRAGMSAPPVESESVPSASPPPRAGGGAPPARGAAAAAAPAAAAPPSAAPPPAAGGSASLKPCPNCGKEIPPEYLVCPFCGAVTQ